jgi:hypothetical protein
MHAAIDVGLGMVHNFMDAARMQLVIGHGVIGVDWRSEFHTVENFILQSLVFHIRHHRSANLAFVAVEHWHYNSLARRAGSVTAF